LTVGEPTRRPGGRTAEVTRRVNDAVLELLVEGGVVACTFAAVAERAGVERSTLYRRYGDRWAMMIDAILGYSASEAAAVSLGSFREDLRFMLGRMATILATPLGPALWAVGAALRAGSAPEHRARFWETRLRQILPIFDRAQALGELAPRADPEEIFAFAMGAVHFRMLVIGEPVDSTRIEQIVDDVCRLYCRKRRSVEVEPAIAAAEVE
jgi:AcrR family transcriptional regulator